MNEMTPTPYYQSPCGRAIIYKGDALEVLHSLEKASIDAIVTDPPYSSGGMTRGDRTMGVHAKYVQSGSVSGHELAAFGGDNRDQRAYAYWSALWLSKGLRAVKPGGACVLFTDWRQLPTTCDALQAGGWVWRGVVPWFKPSSRPQSGRFNAACEYAVWGTAGPRGTDAIDGACLPGFYESSAPRDREHITQKPLDVMRGLVQIAPEGGVLLDPFGGSGTTGVAAILEGRRFIGVETVEHFADVTVSRLKHALGTETRDAQASPSLFDTLNEVSP